jgi:MFS-type transporter involved in bile tolerance (Atg22 family)
VAGGDVNPYLHLAAVLGAALNGTSSVLYATVAEFVDPNRHSRSFGLFYTIGMASGAVSPIIFGVVSDLAGVSMALAIIGISALLTVPLCLVLRRSMGAGR